MVTSKTSTTAALASNGIILINAADKNKLVLVRKNLTTIVDDEVVIGDLYRDPANLAVSIIVVQRHMPVEDLAKVLTDPASTPKNPASQE